jgi:hypothetical protein
MKIYSEIELREMISNLRLVKEVANEYELQDESEIDLTTYEILLENHLNNKYKEIDKWLNKNGFNKLLI